MELHPFVRSVASIRLLNCFNPYSERCLVHDHLDAPQRRSSLLSALLYKAEESEIGAIWVGRDLGYRGGRRTGLALTDDIHLQSHASRWGVAVERATLGNPLVERTASIIWSVLDAIYTPIFLWNVFPFHPHESGNAFTNRSHNSSERRVGEEILSELITLLKPREIIAVGNDAFGVAVRLAAGITVQKVRHPSYGGQNEFLSQLRAIYTLDLVRPSLFESDTPRVLRKPQDILRELSDIVLDGARLDFQP